MLEKRYKLIISNAGDVREEIILKALTCLGRGQKTDIQVKNSKVSREHLHIHYDGYSIAIEDLGSTNCTFINGRKLNKFKKYSLESNDHVSIGTEALSLEFIEIVEESKNSSKVSPEHNATEDYNDKTTIFNQAFFKESQEDSELAELTAINSQPPLDKLPSKSVEVFNEKKENSPIEEAQVDEVEHPAIPNTSLAIREERDQESEDDDNEILNLIKINADDLEDDFAAFSSYENELKDLYEEKFKSEEKKQKVLLEKIYEEQSIAAREEALKIKFQARKYAEKIVHEAKSTIEQENFDLKESSRRIQEKLKDLEYNLEKVEDELANARLKRDEYQKLSSKLQAEHSLFGERIDRLMARIDSLQDKELEAKTKLDGILEKKYEEFSKLEEIRKEREAFDRETRKERLEFDEKVQQLKELQAAVEEKQELLDQIISKSETESKEIIQRAEDLKAEILEEGQKKSELILSEAKLDSEKLLDSARSEVNEKIKNADNQYERILSMAAAEAEKLRQSAQEEKHALETKTQREIEAQQEKLRQDINARIEACEIEISSKESLATQEIEEKLHKVEMEVSQKRLEAQELYSSMLERAEKEKLELISAAKAECQEINDALDDRERQIDEERKAFDEELEEKLQSLELELAQKAQKAEDYYSSVMEKAEVDRERMLEAAKIQRSEIQKAAAATEREIAEKLATSTAKIEAKENACHKEIEEKRNACQLEVDEKRRICQIEVDQRREACQKDIDERRASLEEELEVKTTNADDYYTSVMEKAEVDRSNLEQSTAENCRQMVKSAEDKCKEITTKATAEADAYYEGKLKTANQEHDEIVTAAHAQADELVKNAQEESRHLLENANAKYFEEKESLLTHNKGLKDENDRLIEAINARKEQVTRILDKANEKADRILENAKNYHATEKEKIDTKRKEVDEAQARIKLMNENAIEETKNECESLRAQVVRKIEFIEKKGEDRLAQLDIEYMNKEKSMRERLDREEKAQRGLYHKVLAKNLHSMLEAYLDEYKTQKVSKMLEVDIRKDIDLLVQETLSGNASNIISNGVSKHISITKDTQERVQGFWKKTVYGVAASFVIAILGYFVSGLDFKETLENRKTASESYLDDLQKERANVSRYSPKKTPGYKSDIYENYLHTENYLTVIKSDVYEDDWIIDLSSFFTRQLDLNENKIVKYISEEGRLFSEFKELYLKIDPEKPEEGIALMHQKEMEFNKKVAALLEDPANFNKYVDFRKRFYLRKLKEWRFANRDKIKTKK